MTEVSFSVVSDMAHVITEHSESPDALDEMILDLLMEIQEEGEMTEDQSYVALIGWLDSVNVGEIIRDYQSKRKGASNA
jgi:hypothetical protein